MKNKSFLKIGVFGFLATSSLLLFNNPSAVEANDDVTTPTHIGTYDGSTTFTTSSSNGVNPALFIEVIDKNGNLVQYESEDGVITVENTQAGAYVTQAKLLGKTMYRDLDTGELLESWEEGRNLELESSKMPVLKTYTNLFTGFVVSGYIDHAGNVVEMSDNILSDFIRINEKNIAFRTFNENGEPINRFGEFAFYDIDKKFIGRKVYSDTTDECTTVPDGTKYVRIWTIPVGSLGLNAKAMLVYTTDKPSLAITKYSASNKTNILTANEPVELRGIGDVKDTLDLTTGELTQRIGETLIDKMDSYGATTSDGAYFIPNSKMPQGFKYSEKTLFIDKNNVVNKIISGGTGNWHFHVNQKTDGSYYTKAEVNEFLAKNSIQFFGELITPTIKTVDLTASDYFSPETTAQISIEGETVPLVASITVPTETLSFVIDPNQEADKQFIAPEFSVTNDTYAPLRLEIKSFTQLTNEMNDVLPSKYSDWDVLNKTESNDVALAVVPQKGDGWKSLTEGERYVADDSNYELGVIKPTETVDFKFSALHGPTILKPLNLKYELSFIFDFE